MAYFNAYAACIDDTLIVREVIVIPYCNDDDDDITAYCNGIGLAGNWIDTSYTGSRRGKFAGVGDTYDPTANVFKPPAAPEVTP